MACPRTHQPVFIKAQLMTLNWHLSYHCVPVQVHHFLFPETPLNLPVSLLKKWASKWVISLYTDNTTKTKKPLFCNHSVMTDMTRCSTYQKWQEQIFIFLWPFLFKDQDLIDWKKQVSTLLEDSLVVQFVQLGPKDPKIEKKLSYTSLCCKITGNVYLLTIVLCGGFVTGMLWPT